MKHWVLKELEVRPRVWLPQDAEQVALILALALMRVTL
jgi:hypothetical protein